MPVGIQTAIEFVDFMLRGYSGLEASAFVSFWWHGGSHCGAHLRPTWDTNCCGWQVEHHGVAVGQRHCSAGKGLRPEEGGCGHLLPEGPCGMACHAQRTCPSQEALCWPCTRHFHIPGLFCEGTFVLWGREKRLTNSRVSSALVGP